MLAKIENYPLPVVGLVRRHAIVGEGVALHCDFVVAKGGAEFAMHLAQIGLSPTLFLTRQVIDVAVPALACKILLLGGRIDAGRGLETIIESLVDHLPRNAPISIKVVTDSITAQQDLATRFLIVV